MVMVENQLQQNMSTPWYLNLPIQKYAESIPGGSVSQIPLPIDPVEAMQNEKIGQSDRLLHHTAKAILTRTALEREQSRNRAEEMQIVRNHCVQFDDEPFGMNKERDSMRWSLEQNLIALGREERAAQLSFWNDIWTISRELLTCMNENEKQNRRRSMADENIQIVEPRMP